jgi:hypothetical protein
MPEQSVANELAHDLRGKKLCAFEIARAQNICELTKTAKTRKRHIQLNSASDTDSFDECHAAEEVTDYLQQALVMDSSTRTTEKPANQTDSDSDERLTEDSEQQRTDAPTVSKPTPSAPLLENIVEDNEQILSEQNTPRRHSVINNAGAERIENQEILLLHQI